MSYPFLRIALLQALNTWRRHKRALVIAACVTALLILALVFTIALGLGA
jgi:hypothetical protein